MAERLNRPWNGSSSPALGSRNRTTELLTRRCVCCGHEIRRHSPSIRDGESIQLESEYCPSCGVDFAERPPRSYAEMEGLLGRPLSDPSSRDDDDDPRDESSLIQRWLAFLFFAMLLFVALSYFTAAAFDVH